jgi:hypothetical protein
MSIKTVFTTRELSDAVADLRAQAGDCEARAVLYFASPRYDPAELGSQMRAAFPGACVAGCTSAGELAGGKMLSGSIAAMLLDGETVAAAAVAVVENLRGGARVAGAFAQLEQQLHAPVSSLDIDKYVGIVLADGLSGAEEQLMEKLGDRTDLVFIGGSAGDDVKFERTHVSAGGKTYTNAAVLMLLHVPNGFDVLKTQSFHSTGKTLFANKVNEATRLVMEFNGRPAVDAYAAALGVKPADAAAQFMAHPLGIMVNGDPFVRSPQRVLDGGIVFYCNIGEGVELELLQADDLVDHTRKAIEARKATGLSIAGIIDFQCILRTLQLRAEDHCEPYGALFNGIPMAGFSTYGEAYIGHMNQTSTMLVFH